VGASQALNGHGRGLRRAGLDPERQRLMLKRVPDLISLIFPQTMIANGLDGLKLELQMRISSYCMMTT
jgi:hypothetical protein